MTCQLSHRSAPGGRAYCSEKFSLCVLNECDCAQFFYGQKITPTINVYWVLFMSAQFHMLSLSV